MRRRRDADEELTETIAGICVETPGSGAAPAQIPPACTQAPGPPRSGVDLAGGPRYLPRRLQAREHEDAGPLARAVWEEPVP
jgi:hypothetical protein